MYSLILLAGVSLVLALVGTPLLRNLFRRWGVVDRPDGGRKIHTEPVPRMGGVPILIAYGGAFGVLMLLRTSGGGMVRASMPAVWNLFPPVIIVFAIGLLDDIRGLKPGQKLAGEAVAALLAVAGGVHIGGVAGFALPPVAGVLVTVVWLVGCANAVNLIDGVDGLAAGIALCATVTMMIAALLGGNRQLAYATAPLAGALLGFLRYNFNPASVFLGDSGSLTLGFLLGCYGVLWGQKSATVIGMTAPLIALAIPLLDAGLAIARRFLRQEPIFAADRSHIHHRLLARGLKPRRVVLMLYAVTGLFAGLSLLQSVFHDHFTGPIVVLFATGTWCGIHCLGYVEFGTARRMVLQGAFRRLLSAQISLDTVSEKIRAAGSMEQCWAEMMEVYRTFGFSAMELQANGREFRAEAAHSGNGSAWQMQVDLQGGNRLMLKRDAGVENHATLAAGFAELLGIVLPVKFAEFRAMGAVQREEPPRAMVAGAD